MFRIRLTPEQGQAKKFNFLKSEFYLWQINPFKRPQQNCKVIFLISNDSYITNLEIHIRFQLPIHMRPKKAPPPPPPLQIANQHPWPSPWERSGGLHISLIFGSASELLSFQLGEVCQKKKVTSLFLTPFIAETYQEKNIIFEMGIKFCAFWYPIWKKSKIYGRKFDYRWPKIAVECTIFRIKIRGVKIDDLKTTVNLLKHRDRGRDRNFCFFEKIRPITPSDRR